MVSGKEQGFADFAYDQSFIKVNGNRRSPSAPIQRRCFMMGF
jgi:hypothetical protein